MGYYYGVVEHDTGLHADAENTVAGQQMIKVEITLAEYRDLVTKAAKADYEIQGAKAQVKAYKQKLYSALKSGINFEPLNESQKADYEKLCADWEVKKDG